MVSMRFLTTSFRAIFRFREPSTEIALVWDYGQPSVKTVGSRLINAQTVLLVSLSNKPL